MVDFCMVNVGKYTILMDGMGWDAMWRILVVTWNPGRGSQVIHEWPTSLKTLTRKNFRVSNVKLGYTVCSCIHITVWDVCDRPSGMCREAWGDYVQKYTRKFVVSVRIAPKKQNNTFHIDRQQRHQSTTDQKIFVSSLQLKSIPSYFREDSQDSQGSHWEDAGKRPLY